jgi:prevent-host-death family protein
MGRRSVAVEPREVYSWMYMTKNRSVAEARQELPALLDDVERGGEVVVTRRGKPIGVLIPYATYLRANSTAFADALERWRTHAPKHLDGTEFMGLRDRSAGR